MEIKQLTTTPFTEYPTVFQIPLSLRVRTKSNDGASHDRTVKCVHLGKDAFIQSAVYSKERNRCEVRVVSANGALTQSFQLKFDSGYEAFKGLKTLHVTLIDAPKKSHGRVRPAKLKTADGKVHYVSKDSTLGRLRELFSKWVSDNVDLTTASEVVNKIKDQNVRCYLDVWYDVGLAYCPRHMLMPFLAKRVSFVLFTEKKPITLQELCDIGLLPGLPELDVPARVLRKYDTKVEYRFVGLVQEGGKPNHTMNLQTAKRVSRFTGESVSEQELLRHLRNNIPSFRLGPLRIWAIGTATKTTKEQK